MTEMPRPALVAQEWHGALEGHKNRGLPKKVAARGYIADAKEWARVWKRWRGREDLPKIDFRQFVVFVGVVKGAKYPDGRGHQLHSACVLHGRDLMAKFQGADVDTPGFSYALVAIYRPQFDTINGQAVKKATSTSD
jgi:hypothetical protein